MRRRSSSIRRCGGRARRPDPPRDPLIDRLRQPAPAALRRERGGSPKNFENSARAPPAVTRRRDRCERAGEKQAATQSTKNPIFQVIVISSQALVRQQTRGSRTFLQILTGTVDTRQAPGLSFIFLRFLDIRQFKPSRPRAVLPEAIGPFSPSVAGAVMWEAVSLAGGADQRVFRPACGASPSCRPSSPTRKREEPRPFSR
jgi:hypothetical protein